MARGKSNAGYDHIVNSARGLPKISKPRAVAPPTAPKVPKSGRTGGAEKLTGEIGIGEFEARQFREQKNSRKNRLTATGEVGIGEFEARQFREQKNSRKNRLMP